ncbi:60S ribosomal protein L33A [Mortierella polycephala]|uniref:60S ribosomal protein L33A n=1 Tax=Mortierella polycephala TaxID=41804 RepID=A0A9P6Q5Y9_9FUNG|nr:60S ribosomal protein L33A [Mortierella polycephala]
MAAIVNAARFVRAPLQAAARRQYSVAASSTKAAAPAAGYSNQRIAIAVAVAFGAGCEVTMGYFYFFKSRVLGFKRAKRNQRPDISLIQIEGVKTAADTEFYLGKRVAFVYRAKREVNGSKIRCVWGRITRTHGGSGAVKARFRNNLPAKSFGASVRVMMYPSRV